MAGKQQVNLRLDPGVVDRVDRVKGLIARNTWLANAVLVVLEDWEQGNRRVATDGFEDEEEEGAA